MAAKKKKLLLFNLADYESEAPRIFLRWCSVDESGLSDNEKEWLDRNKGLTRFDVDDGDELWRVEKGGGGFKGLVLDQPSSSSSSFSPVPFEFTKYDTLYGCEIGLVDSFLVIAGGLDFKSAYNYVRSNRFAYLDTKLGPDGKWIEMEMSYPRSYPLSVSLAGKLYIFGEAGFCGSNDYLEAWPHPEVFDSKDKTLQPLPGKILGDQVVPHHDFYLFPKQVAAVGDIIITFSVRPYPRRSLLLLYDTRDASWSYPLDVGPVFPPEFSQMVYDTNLLTVGDTIYWFSPRSFRLHAYQFKFAKNHRFKLSQSISQPVDFGLSEWHDHIGSDISLLSLSPQLLCLVWHETCNTNPSFGPQSVCRISKLFIDKFNNGGKESLSVILRSTHTCARRYSMQVPRVLLMEN